MALDRTNPVLNIKEQSIILLTLEVDRADESRFQPEPRLMFVAKPNAKTREDRFVFKVNGDSADTVKENGKTVYLARLALVNGKYVLQNVWGMASAFPVNGNFIIPFGMNVNVAPNSVTYVGRVKATMRKREAGEFRAGPVLPLIDQAVTGMVRSTWEISVADNSERDLALFRDTFPALKDATIAQGPMLVFDRAVAQKMWETDSPAESKEDAKPAPAP